MKILEENSHILLTNYETNLCIKTLEENKKQYASKDFIRGYFYHRECQWLWNAMKPSLAPDESLLEIGIMKAFIQECQQQGYQFTMEEKIMFFNLRPMELVEIHLILEQRMEEYTSEDLEILLDICKLTISKDKIDKKEKGNVNQEEEMKKREVYENQLIVE